MKQKQLSIFHSKAQNTMLNHDEVSEINSKNTKNEILEAYQALLQKITLTKETTVQETKKKKNEEEVVHKASQLTIESIVNNLADAKLSVSKGLDILEQKLTEEYRKLNDLQTAIALENSSLEELYEIKKNANSLAALLLAQKEYKAHFEQEMNEKKNEFEYRMEETKAAWKKEQDDFEQTMKEKQTHTKKERIREEEEYNYTLQLERKKDRDLYQESKELLEKELFEKKLTLQKEFSEREAAILSHEQELQNLRLRVQQFSQELETAIHTTEKNTKEAIERTYQYKIELTAKEVEGEKKLNQQTISSLQQKIKEQEEFIEQLTKKTADADNKVQTIALKAIEGASTIRYYGAFEDTKKYQQSNT